MVRWAADMVRSVGFDLGDVCEAEFIEVRYGEGYETWPSDRFISVHSVLRRSTRFTFF